jgi:hypothetical protein
MKLYLFISSFVMRYQPAELHPLIDDDVIEAVAALASTYETASRGVIFEHRPASLPAERLAAALKPAFADLGGGSAFERSAAVVLRRIEAAGRAGREREPENRRAYIELLGRMLKNSPDSHANPADEEPRLIVP